MTAGHRPPSSPRGFSGFCLASSERREARGVQGVQGVQVVQVVQGFCFVQSVQSVVKYKHNLRGNLLSCNQARGDAAQVMSVCSDLPQV